jgi:hypothetical protein
LRWALSLILPNIECHIDFWGHMLSEFI